MSSSFLEEMVKTDYVEDEVYAKIIAA